MRIAIVSSLFPPFAVGGAEQVAAQLALGLQGLGNEVNVISTCRQNKLGGDRHARELWKGIPVWSIAPRNLYWGYEKPANRLIRAGWHAIDLWNPSVPGPLRRVLDLIRPEVINTHNIDGLSPAVWQVAREYTGAVVHTLHDYHLICPRATMQRRNGEICDRVCGFCKIYAHYHRMFQRHVRVLVAPARAIGDMHRQSGWAGPSIAVIRNGADAGVAHPSHTPEDGPLRVLFLSRLEREKGCETLLSVIPRFGTSPDIQFHIAGYGSYEKRFSELAEHASNTTWHGFVSGPQKRELFGGADVFLQLSECRENAPLSLIEAGSAGLYLVGAEVGGIPEYIDAPAGGLLIPPGNADALFQTLKNLVAQGPAIRKGRPGRMALLAGYGPREMAIEYMKVFRSLVGPREGFARQHESGHQPGIEQV